MKKIICFAAPKTALLLLISFSVFPALADNLYKWVDDKGNVTYQSSPPPDAAVKVEKSSITTGNKNVPDQVEAAEPDAKEVKPIIFYYKPECPTCEEAQAYFEENAVPVNEIDLSENESKAEELEEKLGDSSVPIFEINGKYISGFEAGMLTKFLTKEGYKLPAELEIE